MAARQFHYRWEWRLAATPSALWPLVSDTNRFNRDSGVPIVEEKAGAAPGSRRLRLVRYGVPVEWDEEPFEWVRPNAFGVLRRYHSGPVAEMRVRAQLEPDGVHHSILRYEVDAVPRNALGYVAIPLEIGIRSARMFRKVFARYADEARELARAIPDYAQHGVHYLPAPATLPIGGRERLAAARASLLPRFAPDIVDRLIELVERGDDLSVVRIRPYVLADLWNERRRSILDLHLYATRAGLLDLQWDVLCPMCRGAKQTNNELRGITQPVHCDACNIDFFANFEQSVELTFRPNPAIRDVQVFPYCVGGPQLTPHIVVQVALEREAERVVNLTLEAGRYRVRAGGIAGSQLVRVEPGAAARMEVIARPEWTNEERIVGNASEWVFRNETDATRLLIVERHAWSDQALTAAEVIALQEFRDLFASEALRPGESIHVGNMTILFTDLLDSTRMYREIGDASAFGRVLDHFDVLREAMQAEEGALVKTIGDAVMAVFRRPAGAIRTVLRAQQLLAQLPEGVRPTSLKAGVHFGPCIAVTLNDRLDYFGSTVNIAARLNSLSAGGEIVLSETVVQDPEVERLLQDHVLPATSFHAKLKGYEDVPLRLLRLQAC